MHGVHKDEDVHSFEFFKVHYNLSSLGCKVEWKAAFPFAMTLSNPMLLACIHRY